VSQTSQLQRNADFCAIREKQPYEIVHDNIKIVAEKDVFPPDISFVTKPLMDLIKNYKCNTALDMGCGSGILALAMKNNGVKSVYAVDRYKPAVICTRNNVERNPSLSPIHVLHGDLFSPVPSDTKFDLIVFNHPLYPSVGEPVFGYDPDGGKEILQRFFCEVKSYIHKLSSIIIPYIDIAGKEHDPKVAANTVGGFKSSTLAQGTQDDTNYCIYEFSPE
jgi:release factor glutamine methyltransferase